MCTYVHMYICTYVHNLPPLIINPQIKKKTLGEQQFATINLEGGTIIPLIKKTMFGQTSPEYQKNGGFVVDRKSIVLLRTSIRKASGI